MIKRDNLIHVVLHPESDGQGGNQSTEIEVIKPYAANVSVTTSVAEVQNYGLKQQLTLHTTTNYKLPDGKFDRFLWNVKTFRLVRQTPFGNEWVQTLVEVNQ